MVKKTLLVLLALLLCVPIYARDTGSRDSYRNSLRNLKFDIIPATDGVRDLGSAAKKFDSIFANSITLSSAGTFDQVIIDTDNGEALLIRRDGDAGDVIKVDTRDKSSFVGDYFTLYVEPTGGQHTGNGNGIVGVYAINRVNTGTQSVFMRGFQSQVATKGDAILSGAGGQGAAGLWSAAIHDSTGTTTELRGVHAVATILPGGSTTTAGLTDVAIGLNAAYGFGSSGGTGTATLGAGIRVEAPTTTAAGSRVITTGHGLLIEDQTASGITTAYSIKTEGGKVQFQQTVAEDAVLIDQDTNDNGLDIDSEATSAALINLSSPQIQTGNGIRFADFNSLTTGRAFFVHSNSSDSSNRDLSFFHNEHASATDTTVALFQQDAVGTNIQTTGGTNVFTSELEMNGNIQLKSNNEVRFYDNGNYVGFEAGTLAGDQIWVLPTADGGTAGDIIKTDASGNLAFVTPTVDIDIALTSYDAEPARASETNLHGGLLATNTAAALGPATPANDIAVSKGIGKIMIVVNAGSDLSGTITITGESIDRDTGASTGADTDTITVDAVSIDGSDTDSNGNTRHSFTDAYISSKWFTGAVVLSTSTLNLSDVDVYHVSFEQMNDQTALTLKTFDVNLFTTNVAAEFDAYLYCLEVTAGKCSITRCASLNVGADGETAIANKYWRLRRGNIAQALDGSTDGLWADLHYTNSPSYVEDVTTKIWVTKSQTLTLS